MNLEPVLCVQCVKKKQKVQSGNILVHGLLTCKKCSGVWNKDVNSATNIYIIAKNAINGLERPKYLYREKKVVALTNS